MTEEVCYIAKYVYGIKSCEECYGKLACEKVSKFLDVAVTVNK